MIKVDSIVIAKLPKVDPYIRKTLLYWIGKCISNPGRTAKTETGRKIRLVKLDNRQRTLVSDDGNLKMPNYETVIERANGLEKWFVTLKPDK